jgi:hypothetical protein
MNRRHALRNIGLLIGVSAATGLALGRYNFLAGCSEKKSNGFFSTGEQELIAEIAEMIIPATATPGAKEAGVPAFIEMMVQECYRKPEQEIFRNGLKEVEAKAKAAGDDFASLRQEQKKAILAQLEEESMAKSIPPKVITPPTNDATKSLTANKQPPRMPPSFRQMIKELVLLGFFTSETGMTKALEYVPVPGRLELIKLKKDQKAYAEYTDRFR